MHDKLPCFFSFIKTHDENHIRKLDKKIAIIFRDYETRYTENLIINIKKTCKKSGRKFFLANNLKLAIKLDLDGVYLPAFNQRNIYSKNNYKKKFTIIGSAHSIKEIKIKEQQGVKLIFLSPLFKVDKSKKFLDPIKFNFLASHTKIRVIALGGINRSNIKKLKLLKSYGFAAISYFKNHDKV